ncbi:alpha-galactosidase [Xylanimonas sp. McL0601]|uniref:alpha-galactosidase n=1 Tax=Xylanimonas sp. McL0601 TaxID=3414739 RepID=UPI003CF54486
MTRIAFLGAGSAVFTRQLLVDLLRYDDLPTLEIALHDIDPDRLEIARATAEHVAARLGKPLQVVATLDRREALTGATAVVIMIQVGGVAATYVDLQIPAKYGLRQTIGDTTGVGGVFRGLRTFPVISQIARDVLDVCPDAWVLNYTNPMAMNVWWWSIAAPAVKTVGLCHSVFWTVHGLNELIGVPLDGTTYAAAGVNHQAWLTEWSRDGQSLYPLLDAKIAENPELERRVRVEMYRRIGYYPTETSEHSSEYLSWFLRSDEQIDHYRIEPLQYLGISDSNVAEVTEARRRLAAGEDLDLPDGDDAAEYAPQIIHSLLTGTERWIHANVPNAGLIDNLPQGAAVEVPAFVDRDGVHPKAVGAIPTAGAALNRTYLSVAELAVEAALTGDARTVRQAVLVDGNASSTLTPQQIWDLCDELTTAHKSLLPRSLGGDVELVLP